MPNQPSFSPALRDLSAPIRPLGRALDAGVLLSAWLPRGKGAVVRGLGKRLVRPDSRYMMTRHGAKLVISPDSLDVYTTMRAHGNAWDYADFEVCRNSTPEGGVFYDIGANVGYFCIEMAQVSNGRTFVVGIEPQAGLAHAIARSARLNGFNRVMVLNALAGETTGMADFYLAPATIHSSAVADSHRPHHTKIQMQMVSIDDLAAKGAIMPPDFVKMDVEGSEHVVFLGAARVLRQAKPNIYLEYHVRDDVGGRIKDEIASLTNDAGCYDLYGSPTVDRRRLYQQRLVRMSWQDDLSSYDAIYLRNRERAVPDAAMFAST